MASYKITLSQSYWSDGTTEFYYDTVSAGFFADSDLTIPISGVTPPVRELYRFNGFFAANSTSAPGTQYIDEDGNFTDALFALSITAAKTFYVNGTQVSYKLTLDDNGGSGGDEVRYYRIDGGGYFDNYLCEGMPVSIFSPPVYDGYEFTGYWASTSSSTRYTEPNGLPTDTFRELDLTSNKTIYAKWMAPYKITVSANSGTGGTTAFYYGSISGKFYASTDVSADPITSITPHTRASYRFLGYYEGNNTTSTCFVSADGTISPDWTPAAADTIYCQWQLVSYKVTCSKSSGTGGTDAVYYAVDGGGFYADDLVTTPATGVEPPTRSGYVFVGYFASSSSSAVQYTTKDGGFTADFLALTLTGSKTMYARWARVYSITLDPGDGSGGTDVVWYNSSDGEIYREEECVSVVEDISVPTRECFRFLGFFNSTTGDTQYIDEDGELTTAFTDLSITADKTIYAQWDRMSYKATLDPNGGEGSSGAFYYDGENLVFYLDDQLTTATTSVVMPTRTGYDCLGIYASPTGGSRYVNGDGEIIAVSALTASMTLYARWSAQTYTIKLDYNGGVGSPASVTVTYDSAIGTLPVPTRDRAAFASWTLDGAEVAADTVWTFGADAVLVAKWRFYFGNVNDYFGLGSDSLVPVSANSGENAQRIAVANAGELSNDVGGVGGKWLNPTVTYQVVRDCDLAVVLGRAYPAKRGVSGYMITSVKVDTRLGSFPVVTVQAVANEGADAINLFPVSLSLKARARAQNLMGAVVGGEHLHALDLTASVTPVVLVEGQMPCASDVVEGKVLVNATLLGFDGDEVPTAGDGFVMFGAPLAESGVNYLTWQTSMEKGLEVQ